MSALYDAFRDAAAHHDASLAADHLADDVRLFASLAARPFEGKPAVMRVFSMLLDVFDDLRYVAEYDNAGGKVILTSGRIGGREVDGVQVLTLDADGRVTEFRDFIRPFSGALALRDAAEEHVAGPA